MNKYLSIKNYSLTTKVILIFILSMVVFNLVKIYLTIPILEKKDFTYNLNEVTQILKTNEKQIETLIYSLKNQVSLEEKLSKLKVETTLNYIFQNIENIENSNVLKDILEKNEINNLCNYEILTTNTTFNEKNDALKHIDLTNLEKWYTYEQYDVNPYIDRDLAVQFSMKF